MKLAPIWLLVALLIIDPVSNLIAQTIQGKVLDIETKETLAFVQIGILNKNIGVLTDENGLFQLDQNRIQDLDSLVFSYLGYAPQIVSFQELKTSSTPTIFLTKQIFELPDVNIQAKALTKNKKIGYKKTPLKMFHTGWSNKGMNRNLVDDPVGERGTIIKLKGKTALIKNINFHIADNEYDSILCRIHLYSIKDGLPDKELTQENVFVKTAQKYGWVTVPIDHLELVLQEDVIATVEWVKAWKQEPVTGEGLHFSLGLIGKLIWREMAHVADWDVNKVYHLAIYLDAKTN